MNYESFTSEVPINSAKSAVAVTILRSVPKRVCPVGRSAAAVCELDEFIARHMRETGAPGMTLALANRDGLIRVFDLRLCRHESGLASRTGNDV